MVVFRDVDIDNDGNFVPSKQKTVPYNGVGF